MSQMNGSIFEQLARNTTSNDIPTLIELLKSPILLEPVAKQFQLRSSKLRKSIKIIGNTGFRSSEPKGILKVILTGRNRDQSKLLLRL